MKPIFERVLFRNRRKARPAGASSSVSSTLTTRDIETYYLRVIGNCLKRMLIKEEDVQIGVRRTGTAPSGLSSFTGYVRVLRWDPVATPVVLQNLPVIDARIRKVVSASVLLEHTQFDGLWFQATSSTKGSPTTLLGMPAELRYVARPASV
jgi:hypothetical protein